MNAEGCRCAYPTPRRMNAIHTPWASSITLPLHDSARVGNAMRGKQAKSPDNWIGRALSTLVVPSSYQKHTAIAYTFLSIVYAVGVSPDHMNTTESPFYLISDELGA
jgi:hypothetical protein